MIDLNPSQNLPARPCADCLRVLLLLLAGWLALVTPLRADNPPTYLFQWGNAGNGNGQFQNPYGIALDTTGNVYEVDYESSRVQKFASNGNYLTQWGSHGSGNGQIESAATVAVDSSNNVYVVDASDNRIEKFDSSGNYLTQWGSYGSGNGQFYFSYLDGVAFDRSNDVFVTDFNNNRIEKFDNNGNYLAQWGSLGTNNGQFAHPNGIALDSSDNVYVLDAGNSRIEKFDRNGNYLAQWGSFGTNNGQFNNPGGIAVDSNNNVYVVDGNNHSVQKFDRYGNYLTQWGSFGSGNGQFFYPEGIAIDSSGNFIYVADNGNNRIQVFVNNLNIIPPIITGQPAGRAVLPGASASLKVMVVGAAPFSYQWISNNVPVANATNSLLMVSNINLSATYAVIVTNINGSALSSDARLSVIPAFVTTQPASVTATGAVLNGSATVGNSAIVAFFDWGTDTNYGNIAGPIVVSGNTGSNNISGAVNGISGVFHYRIVATNAAGMIYGSDQEFAAGPNAQPPTFWFAIDSSAAPGGFLPGALALDRSNNIYVADGPTYLSDHQCILKLASDGTYLTQWGSFGTNNGQFNGAAGIAVDGSNNVYVTDSGNYRVEKFTSSGLYVTQWGSFGSGNDQFNGPVGIAVDSSNNVYVADNGNNRIEKFDRNGDYLMQWGSQGTNDGQFKAPSGVAVDSGNNVYVTDSGNARVQKFDSSGNYLVQWGSSGNGNGQFYYPAGIATDTSNNFYVTDPAYSRVEKFDSNGNYLAQWGGFGRSPGQFGSPVGVAVNSTGYFIYVADDFNSPINAPIQIFVNNTNIVPPFITSQPATQAVAAGLNATLSVSVIGTAPFAYQWASNNVAVPGATNATLTLANVNQSYSGSTYCVLVTNDFGSQWSSIAVLTVIPGYATTLPSNGLSTNSAGLNGTVTVAENTMIWFEWGADTHYGNIAGATVVPGGSGSTNISATLSGLSAGVYHYQVVITNESGVLYGGDQEFAVGFDALPPTYLYEIDSGAVLAAGFSPSFVALDNSNNVYVTDDYNSRVEKFDRSRAYLTQWGGHGIGNGQFYYPQGIAVDRSNNVYVADTDNSRVEKFDSKGNYLTQWGSSGFGNGHFYYPPGIGVDSSNNVYVASGNSIQKFDSDGNYLTQWGSGGTNTGQFGYTESIAVDKSNNVYVADSGNNRVDKFDSNGNYLAQWGSNGTNTGQFEGPSGIAVDSSNHVYVVDNGNARVEKFDGSGNYLAQWGGYGSGNGHFNSPYGVAVDGSGNFIYVADTGNGRIQVFVNNTNIVLPVLITQPTSQAVAAGTNVTFSVSVFGTAPFAYQWTSNNVVVNGATNATFTLTNVSLSASGSIYSVLVANNFGSELSGNALLTVLPAADFITPMYLFQIESNAVPVGSQSYNPISVALDSSNNVYVLDYLNDRVVKFDGSGNFLTQWGSYGSGNGQFDLPSDIAVDSSNNVYVVDLDNNRVEKFDSSGKYLTQWGSLGTNNGQFDWPNYIALDSSNNVYVTDFYNNRVEKFDSSGTYLAQWGSYGSGNGQFDYPFGVAVDSSNNVYVADYDNDRVEKFTTSGNYLTQWGGYGTNNGQFHGPSGVTVGSNNVYVSDLGNSRIEKFSSSGAYLAQWGSYGSGNGQFEGPEAIAVDRTWNFIYVADTGNHRIQVFVNNANIVPPIITQQPTNQTVIAGANVAFSVGVVGAESFSYQWTSNNVPVPGATNATFTLPNVSLSESADYAVLITNGIGTALSSNAVLTVLPALVTTQPANGFSATGAVLNGSVNVGVESLAWFEWGTDTSYGNIAGATILPGNNASNSVSAALSGLPGNFYHYRLDAANDFGIVYGQDELFTVGFAPSATTLPPTIGANGATFEAAVNPEGWDTTVYFQWVTPTLPNTTPGIDIGAGVTSVNVSNFVSGVALFPTYQYRVVASNALGTAYGTFAYDPNQTHYFFSGSETNITLPPGTYIITAYGARGGGIFNSRSGDLGAEMSAEFNFSTSTNLTLLVGGVGGFAATVYNYNGGGGGGGSFVVQGGTPLVVAGGGGGAAARGGLLAYGGISPITTFGSAGGGNAGGSGGTGGGGGTGGDAMLIGFGNLGDGAGGGGGFYTDGTGGRSIHGYALPEGEGTGGLAVASALTTPMANTPNGGGGLSFVDGGAGGLSDLGGGLFTGFSNGVGGFGGGGGGFSGNNYGFGGGGGGYSGGGGGGAFSYTTLIGGGGGGGSIIDPSAIAILAEVSGIFSPDSPYNGEVIITAISTPLSITTGATFGFTNGVFGFSMTGPSGSSVVIQASTDLNTWIPLQTNLLGGSPLHFSDPQSPANTQRFYRAQLLP